MKLWDQTVVIVENISESCAAVTLTRWLELNRTQSVSKHADIPQSCVHSDSIATVSYLFSDSNFLRYLFTPLSPAHLPAFFLTAYNLNFVALLCICMFILCFNLINTTKRGVSLICSLLKSKVKQLFSTIAKLFWVCFGPLLSKVLNSVGKSVNRRIHLCPNRPRWKNNFYVLLDLKLILHSVIYIETIVLHKATDRIELSSLRNNSLKPNHDCLLHTFISRNRKLVLGWTTWGEK